MGQLHLFDGLPVSILPLLLFVFLEYLLHRPERWRPFLAVYHVLLVGSNHWFAFQLRVVGSRLLVVGLYFDCVLLVCCC
jgi:hypothetical protein